MAASFTWKNLPDIPSLHDKCIIMSAMNIIYLTFLHYMI
jgi:hypothetical protein